MTPNPHPDPMHTPTEAVRSAIEQFFHAMDTQDFDLMTSLIAHDAEMIHIGTDTGEIWRGWDELREATEEQFETLDYYTASIRDLTIHLSDSGDVAWYAHLLDARIKSDGPEIVWKGARFTGVFERRDGRWKMVQSHVSIPESDASFQG